ncbi:hypothetical protein [Pararhizobium gei]|uniref:hypothetical protein n=1 Tax=Pararhizobium gei TaxID=1395951 RepID=UPI0023DC9468|nr:hypothetical protein [Rhizobium gei]
MTAGRFQILSNMERFWQNFLERKAVRWILALSMTVSAYLFCTATGHIAYFVSGAATTMGQILYPDVYYMTGVFLNIHAASLIFSCLYTSYNVVKMERINYFLFFIMSYSVFGVLFFISFFICFEANAEILGNLYDTGYYSRFPPNFSGAMLIACNVLAFCLLRVPKRAPVDRLM